MFKKLAVMAALIVSLLGIAPLCAFADDTPMVAAAAPTVALGGKSTTESGSPSYEINTLQDGYYYGFYGNDDICGGIGTSVSETGSFANYIYYNQGTIYVKGEVTIKGKDFAALSVSGGSVTIKNLPGETGILTLGKVDSGTKGALEIGTSGAVKFGGDVTVVIEEDVSATNLSLDTDFDGLVIKKSSSKSYILKSDTTYYWNEATDITDTGIKFVHAEESTFPESETTYIAGSGTITYVKDKSAATFILKNATTTGIDASSKASEVRFELFGTNVIKKTSGAGAALQTTTPLKIGGTGTLEVINSSGTGIECKGFEMTFAGKDTVDSSALPDVKISAVLGIYGNGGNILVKSGYLDVKGYIETTNEEGSGGTFEVIGGKVDIEVNRSTTTEGTNIRYGAAVYAGNVDFAGGSIYIRNLAESGIGTQSNSIVVGKTASATVVGGTDAAFDMLTSKMRNEQGAIVGIEGELNALVYSDLSYIPETSEYIAYGESSICVTTGTESEPVKVVVEDSAELEVEGDKKLYVYDLEINGKLINSGEIKIINNGEYSVTKTGIFENNGIVYLPSSASSETVKSLGLVGTGYVMIGTYVYDHNGNACNIILDGINLSNINETDGLQANYETNGWWYERQTKTLYLKNIVIRDGYVATGGDTSILIPNEDINIVSEGAVSMGTITVVIPEGSGGIHNTVTISGEDLTVKKIVLNTYANLLVKNKKLTVIGEIMSAGDHNFIRFEDVEQAVVGGIIMPVTSNSSESYGLYLENSKVTVNGDGDYGIFADKIYMDKDSVLKLNKAPISGRGHYENGLDVLVLFLEEGHIIKKVTVTGTVSRIIGGTYYTIWDTAAGKVVDTTTLLWRGGGTDDGITPPTPTTPSGGGGTTIQYKITVEETENGVVDSNRKYTSAGTRVTITTTADDKFKLGKIMVVDSKDNEIELEDKGDGVFVFTMPKDDVWVIGDFDSDETTTKPTVVKTFKDVKDDDWFKNPVDYVTENGIMSGLTDDTFGPNELTSRAMLVTILWRMEGCPESSFVTNFTDINENEYYYKAVLWAAEKGIVSGITDTEFAPSRSVTREQFAAILFRYAGLKGYDTTQGGMAIREYLDFEEISEYALQSLTWAVNTGIISGRGNNKIEPNGGATRAEVASMIMRFKLIYER